jgi:hypothetical protein
MINETKQDEASVVPSTGKPEMLWHYTIGYHLPEILRSGVIRQAATLDADERPVVWFSSNQEWEHGCDRGGMRLDTESLPDYEREEIEEAKRLGRNTTIHASTSNVVMEEPASMEYTEKHFGGLVRFGMAHETAPLNWYQIKRKANMASWMAKALEDVTIRKGGSVREWYGCFEPVPREKWLAIETYDNGEWVPLTQDFLDRAVLQRVNPKTVQ